MFEPQVPRSRGAHRHAAEDDPIAVDAVATTDILDGLENIRLAGPAVAVLDPAEWMELDERCIGRVAVGPVPLVEPSHEAHLAHPDRTAAPVQHDVEPHHLLRVMMFRHEEAVGLPGAVDLRHIPQHYFAAPVSPGPSPLRQRRHAFGATIKGPLELPDIVGRELTVMPQGPGHPLGEDRRIGKLLREPTPGGVEGVVQRPQSRLERLPSLRSQRLRIWPQTKGLRRRRPRKNRAGNTSQHDHRDGEPRPSTMKTHFPYPLSPNFPNVPPR